MSEERKVQEVMARYVRAVDARDGAAIEKLYMPEGYLEVFQGYGPKAVKIGELRGAARIGYGVSNSMPKHAPHSWSHHFTHDSIIEVNGDTATLDVQFIVFSAVGDEMPAGGWKKRDGQQGRLQPIEAGYYMLSLRKIDGAWRIETVKACASLPAAYPEGAFD